MADLFGIDLGAVGGDLSFEMQARFSRDGQSRLELVYTWDRSKPAAAWLMNNPSIAGREGKEDAVTWDPTARRVVHFSRLLGAGSAILLNWCPIVETDPADLWRRLKRDGYPADLEFENRKAIAEGAGRSRFLVLACGDEGMRRHYAICQSAVDLFVGLQQPLCLGTSSGGAPLHPLARGKHAILNSTMPRAFDRSAWASYRGE